MNKKLFPVTFLLLSIFVTAKAQQKKETELSALPDVDVYDTNGGRTSLHQLAKNKVLFIDCWFIPCPPCFMEMGVLHKVYAHFARNKDLCFITICMTDSAQVNAFIRQDTIMKAYVDQYQYFSGLKNFKLPVYFMKGCSSKVPLHAAMLRHFAPGDKSNCPDLVFRFSSYPTSMVFDKAGKQVFKETGLDSPEKYELRLTKALTDALSDGN